MVASMTYVLFLVSFVAIPIDVASRNPENRFKNFRTGNCSTWHCRNAIALSMTDDTVSNQRRFPDPEKCRTRYLGKSLGFTKCLMENSDACPYAVRFASGVSCYHPDRRSFDRTGLP
jgi:hypothetical protein